MPKKRAPIFANKKTGVYHDSKRKNDRCRKSAIKKANRVEFDSPEAADRADFRPCCHCFPIGEE